jgi:hypothetical protein
VTLQHKYSRTLTFSDFLPRNPYHPYLQPPLAFKPARPPLCSQGGFRCTHAVLGRWLGGGGGWTRGSGRRGRRSQEVGEEAEGEEKWREVVYLELRNVLKSQCPSTCTTLRHYKWLLKMLLRICALECSLEAVCCCLVLYRHDACVCVCVCLCVCVCVHAICCCLVLPIL